ncbi:MAG: hypothetical protein AB7F90_09065 [Nitrospirales bacterium]
MKTIPSLTVRWRNRELYVIPAKHFCHVFAEGVNRICANPATKPEAIAVELGPDTLRAALRWMVELGVGTSNLRHFPVMLALIKRNTMIRASYREKAWNLQRETGMDITEFNSDFLRRELGFSEYNVLFLSPIDSIIEGLRCGVELGVPVYGVDLEETAAGLYRPALLEDLQAVGQDMDVYLARNLKMADTYRDDEIDSRREWAMAARLKTLLMKHQRVAFTCGMAHWLRIQELLFDDTVGSAGVEEGTGVEEAEMKRVVVHPEIATGYVDLFPSVVRAYERRRRSVSQAGKSRRKYNHLDTAALFHENVRRGYQQYFLRNRCAPQSRGKNPSPDTLRSFEVYLENLCRLRQRLVPDLYTTVKAGREVIDKNFANTLARAFMRFPWTSPKDHPGCAVLRSGSNSGRQIGSGRLIDEGGTSRYFYFRSPYPNYDLTSTDLLPYEGEACDEDEELLSLHAWHPWNCLLSAMSFQALKRGGKRTHRIKPALFEGSLLDGIHMKPTIRGFSRGEEHVYVRDACYDVLPGSPSLLEAFPAVWLFAPGEHPNGEWNVLVEPSTFMAPHIQDREGFRNIVKAGGKSMVVVIGFGDAMYREKKLSKGQTIKIEKFHGLLIFQPIFWTNRQFARWAELTRYRRNPFCRDTYLGSKGGGDLKEFYAHAHGLKFDEYDWETTLLLMALPFARRILSVVIPDGYRINRVVYEKAKRYGVNLVITPTKMFPPASVSRLSICHLAPVIKTEPECAFPRSVEQAIGESQTAYQHLLPPELLNFAGG